MRFRLPHIISIVTVLAGTVFSLYAQSPNVPITYTNPGYPNDVPYGVNNFARVVVRELPNGLTRFFVPGKLKAKRVLLSGSFNSWSTLQGVMLKTDSGWIRDVRLEPGIYEYKYIFDGNWNIDGNNNIRQDDGAGNTNSVYYRYNYTFKLQGYQNAHRVVVAGDFNHWNINQLIMIPVADGWECKLYLREGSHEYHFYADGRVVNETAGKNAGNQGPVVNVGETINFRLAGFERAQQVYVSGDFNKWVPNGLAMKRINGVWTLPYTLPPGNYQYKFVVDGNWITDPTNAHKAIGGDQLNSFFSVTPNRTFTLKGFGNAKRVILSGSFNNWSEDGYTLEHTGDEWTISLRLKPGKYLYKFIIDGKWIIDPANKQWEQNQFGTGNSVMWVE